MKLEGILYFIGVAVLIEFGLMKVLTALPYFKDENDLKVYVKFFIALIFAESITMSTVFLTQAVMVFGYFGIVTFPYLDAGLSGLLIAGGPAVIKAIYQNIISSREELAKIEGQVEVLKDYPNIPAGLK